MAAKSGAFVSEPSAVLAGTCASTKIRSANAVPSINIAIRPARLTHENERIYRVDRTLSVFIILRAHPRRSAPLSAVQPGVLPAPANPCLCLESGLNHEHR